MDIGTFQTGTVQRVKKLLNMNVLYLSGQITGYSLSWDLVQIFLNARFKEDEHFKRRLEKELALEMDKKKNNITHRN